jgi:hypothetical protein
MVGCRPVPFVGVAAHVAAQRWMTVRFSGRTYPQLARIVRELCAVAGHWCLPLVAAVAVTVAVSPGQDAFARLPSGVRLVTVRTVKGMAPYLARLAAWPLGFWPECFRRLDVKGGQRPFPEETRSALDIEGKHVTIQGPSPDPSPAMILAPSAAWRPSLSPAWTVSLEIGPIMRVLPLTRQSG